MALFKSSNPTLNEKIFQNPIDISGGEVMTERGTLNKFFFLSLMILASASFTWSSFGQGKNVMPWMIGGAIGGFIVAIVITFKKEWAAFLSPLYALLEGLFLGGISVIINASFAEKYPGIVTQAVLLTFGTVFAMYFLYRFRIIKATEKFKSVIITATMGIAIFYLLTMVLGFFHVNIPFVYSSSALGIGFSLVVVVIAALNLILDFDMIEQGTAMGAPKYMEWYCAFGLMVTIVWLYIEILRLLSKLADRR